MLNSSTVIALITGGAQGLGKEIAIFLKNKGLKIIIVDKKEVVEDLNVTYDFFIKTDLSDINDLKKSVQLIKEKFPKIDVLINNAAIKMFKPFFEFSTEESNALVFVNYTVPLMLTKELYPLMVNNNFGRIINISSVSALKGYKSGSMYCASKSALLKFTESAGNDLINNHNITMNAICPDSFSTQEGKKLDNYDKVVKKVLHIIDNIISTNVNSKINVAATLKRKIYYSLLSIQDILIK